jgi:hypothetical protein
LSIGVLDADFEKFHRKSSRMDSQASVFSNDLCIARVAVRVKHLL